MRKAAKDVRRPFHAQTLVLLQQTRMLADRFNQKGNSTPDNLKLFEA
jgi:hypothetical protein